MRIGANFRYDNLYPLVIINVTKIENLYVTKIFIISFFCCIVREILNKTRIAKKNFQTKTFDETNYTYTSIEKSKSVQEN